jgi:hypothetical protein
MAKKKKSKTSSPPAGNPLTPRTDALVASLPQNERGEITFAGIRSIIQLCEALEAEFLAKNVPAELPPS